MPILLLTIMLLSFSCFGTTYYVSNSGNDSNSGTSPASPWQTVLKVDTITFSPGDSVYFNGGDNFEGPLILTESGTSISRITIGSYGSGQGSIYGDHTNATWSAVVGFDGVYSTTLSPVNSVEYVSDINGTNYIKNNKGVQTLTNWLNTFVPTNWGFDSPKVYIKTPDSNPPPVMRLFEFADVEMLGNYLTVSNLDIRQSHHGLLFEGSTGAIAISNFVHDTENIGIYIGNWCIGANVQSNTVTRTGEDAIYLSFAGNAWVHGNNVSWTTNSILNIPLRNTHPERCGVALQQGTNNVVEFNTLSNLWGAFFDYFYENGSTVRQNYGFSANGAAFPNGSGLRLYANVFNLNFSGPGMNPAYAYDGAFSSGPDLGTNFIFNNTFYNFTSYGCFGNGGGGKCIVRNNIFVSTNTTAFQAELTSGANLDYNDYYSTVGTTRWQWNNVNYATLALFQSASGQDAHSINLNPQFVSTTPSAATNFSILSTSPSVHAGTFILATNDFSGRPFTNPPSIGAFEYYGFTNIAASCSQSDVQAAIAMSNPGDTVIVPAGTCAWAASVLLTNQITLLFQGTVIQDSIVNTGDGANSSCLQVAVGPTPQILTRVTGATFTTGSRVTKLFDAGNIHLGGGSGLVRIDHNNFNATLNIGIGGGDVFGVIDHNVFDAQGAFTQPMKLNHASYGGGLHGDGAWALPPWTNGLTEDASAIYIEDNFMTNNSGSSGLGIDSQGGARLVVRHNGFKRITVGGHGTDTTGRERGSRLKDVYNNIWYDNSGDSECGHYRSGTGMIVSNEVHNSTGFFTIRVYRMLLGGFWGPANGTNAWDNNNPTIFGSGTAGSGAPLSMTDNTATWNANQWLAHTIRNVGSGRASVVQGNTATTVTFSGSPDTSTTPNLVFVGGDTYQYRKITTVLDEPGRGQGTLLSGSPATPVGWPNQALEPIYSWSNTFFSAGGQTLNNGGYYSVVDGQEIVNGRNFSWVPYVYPHPLVTGNVPPTPPTITQQPQSTNVYSTQTALFSLTATGRGTLFYQWKTNGVATGTNGPALSVGPCPVAWSGMSVVCVVTNIDGSATSSTATLTVLPDPVITSQPANATVGVGQVASFSVTATGQSTLQYQWSKNGSSIAGATASTYNTPATVSGDNNSQFSVLVTDNAGSVQSATATLTVTNIPAGPDPIITAQPQSTNIYATQFALFSLTASGNTALSYQWRTNGVNTGTNGPALSLGPCPVAWTAMSVLCVVSDVAGSVTSSVATLTVSPDPVISGQPQNATVGSGGVAGFSVTATGQTTLSYQWSRNGGNITGATLSSYTTPVLTSVNNGDFYYVDVTDTAGTLRSSTATLTVTPSPPTGAKVAKINNLKGGRATIGP